MRRLVVALIVATVAFSLVGCGGGAEEPAAETAAPAADAAPAAPAVPVAEVDDSLGLSPLEEQVYEPFPNDPTMTPRSIVSRLEAGQGMIVFFNDGTESVTFDQLAVIEDVLDDYVGLIDLVGFDIGKYVTTETSGTITVDADLDEQTVQKQAIALAQFLDIGSTPYFLIVDDSGYITWRARGFIDAETLKTQMIRATSEH